MILKFDNGYNEREIGRPHNEEEVFQIMNNFMKERNYESFYIRFWKENDVIIYDVGSWSQFFKLYLKGE